MPLYIILYLIVLKANIFFAFKILCRYYSIYVTYSETVRIASTQKVIRLHWYVILCHV